jgi:hypothetical protein
MGLDRIFVPTECFEGIAEIAENFRTARVQLRRFDQ